ncbi:MULTISPECIES: sigma-54 dependent transcriptional regulator [unclassified Mesorhizobium]|uniref:sigma-54-dependent transcriptional regulator n=1 Tax=unclassified Mesorhizobium TaxID=325217 RepID=UPI000BAECDCF|nr:MULTISPECIES: sigma-54 dependent transcriptional regulator [unclassified Mesorhizobium]TGT56583.1 sigma-54-dependent Fis family transcriptional regulator [Mesorhizobium sp. M00.F.Ca.ET.170.01.1.1]AZO11643.1 sigma-54-dependent Fis family transcriptional regulator [Mesorhizobium sp. M3A.F.Ca.ET.080.04.2.1]PBB86738.1 sigma-54-dependent Fis family transcriptional regulator [Mesorhizobium sp. WSM3876]RWB72721.1 MAG: sigma-54-dependent Fis family transcriptional regulator [Mesorhizobium sp.]RWB87
MTGSILIVDDDPVQRRLLEAAVTRFGHTAIVADGGEAGLDVLDGSNAREVSVVILDLVMPGLDGIAVLKAMRERGINVPVIVQTAQGGIETVVSAMRQGAFDFVVKPASPDRLQTSISNALKVEAIEDEVKRASRRRGGHLTFKDLITRSPAMDRVIRLGQKAAASNIPILIEGESGVGKELVARAIQGSGDRRSKPFVTVNCGAIPDNLVESILFGHEKGSFTGATDKHTGKFVEAHSGTLFLDEIGDLPLDVQVKLLRAVQEGEVDPVGGRSTVKVDIRLISATHRNLLQQVKDGRFREDLFYRLNVYPIFVPPLRDRRDDIPYLVRHFMEKVAPADPRRRLTGISAQALAMLQAYDWPGNIRQLENAVFRASVLADGDLLTEEEFPQIRAQVEGTIILEAEPASAVAEMAVDEPSAVNGVASAEDSGEGAGYGAPARLQPRFGTLRALDERGNVRALAEVELEMIKLAIDRYNGQMSEVARRLGIGRSTLYRKLKEYGIDPEAGRVDRLAS